MKAILVIIGLIALIALGYWMYTNTDERVPLLEGVSTTTPTSTTATRTALINNSPVTVTPIEHASLAMTWEGQTILTDPVGDEAMYRSTGEPDLILLTDIHSDHLSTSTLEALVGSSTSLIAPQAVADLLGAEILERTTVLANGETTDQKGFSIEAVPMYNLPESDDSRHPKGRGNGYLIEREGTRVYVAGDTADIPEMRNLTDIDIAFIPMNLPFTMSVDAAADAVLAFAPETVYPYHYRGTDGLSDVERFMQLVNYGNPNIRVVLENWYPNEEQ